MPTKFNKTSRENSQDTATPAQKGRRSRSGSGAAEADAGPEGKAAKNHRQEKCGKPAALSSNASAEDIKDQSDLHPKVVCSTPTNAASHDKPFDLGAARSQAAEELAKMQAVMRLMFDGSDDSVASALKRLEMAESMVAVTLDSACLTVVPEVFHLLEDCVMGTTHFSFATLLAEAVYAPSLANRGAYKASKHFQP